MDELTWSILPAVIIHMVGYWVVSSWSNYNIDIRLLLYPFSDNMTENMAMNISTNVQNYYRPIVLYNFFLMIMGAVLGFCYREFIRKFKLDRRYKLFRFSNKWHYIVTGECLDFPHVPDNYSDVDAVLVDILCDVSGESIIYVGEMFDYYLAADGELESIHLKMPMRRSLNASSGSYYQIPSRFIAIPYKSIVNINFNYLKIGGGIPLSDGERVEETQVDGEQYRYILSD